MSPLVLNSTTVIIQPWLPFMSHNLKNRLEAQVSYQEVVHTIATGTGNLELCQKAIV